MTKETTSNRSNQEADYLFKVICEHLESLHGKIDDNRLRQAFELALTAHAGQERMDGTPYITHPLEVAELCVDLNLDEDAIIAAILHDVVEDTSVRLNQIKQLFGPDVTKMVENLTKIKHIDFFARFTGRNPASTQASNLQRLFVAMTTDLRVIMIKLADRLHNMKTMGLMPEHKRQRIGRETLEFYIPIARRLGLGQIVGEFEDLVFEVLQPEEYRKLRSEVKSLYKGYEPLAQKMIDDVTALLKGDGLAIHRIYGRRKHLYSIFQKMKKQGVGLDGVYDILAIRIILAGNELDCYTAMGLIHAKYNPIFYRFRDFIASPKENGYQTLHTTVLGESGVRVEYQIRTVAMDLEASKGVASHWNYKEGEGDHRHLMKDAAWKEFIMELTSENVGSEEFVAKTRDTLLADQVLILSPRGEVVNLPAGSTCLDFAYYIHTDLGHSARSAKVNGNHVPLGCPLKNGDVVEIIKDEKRGAGPLPEWLVLVNSPKSLLKLKRYYKSRPRSERISVGRNLLRQHIVKEGLYPLNLTANEKLAALLRKLPVRSIDDLYENVALGTFHCDEIIAMLKEIHKTKVKPAVDSTPLDKEERPAARYALINQAAKLGVCQPGGRALRRKVELMRCCTPVPGDKIYGLWSREDRRAYVHRVDCQLLMGGVEGAEMQELAWLEERDQQHYPARIMVVSFNRVGLLFEVMRYLSSKNINLGGAEFSVTPTVANPDRNAQFELMLEVEDKAELEACIAGIKGIEDVLDVKRLSETVGRDTSKAAH